MEPAEQVSERTPPHRWKPIEDLPADRTALSRAAAEVVALRRAWADKKRELEESGALKQFNERLARQWCIETGILEGIYNLHEDTTQSLIDRGLDPALLSRGDTDIGELGLVKVLDDHELTLKGLVAISTPYATPACTEPFTITLGRDRIELESSFDAWLERAVTLGLEIWRRSL